MIGLSRMNTRSLNGLDSSSGLCDSHLIRPYTSKIGIKIMSIL
jgi:hypothetical protein